MSKVAIILGNFSVGSRPLDMHFNNVMINPRGLTGTDLATVMLSSCLVKRGHEVHLFTVHAEPHNKPDWWEGVRLYNLDERFTIIDETFDTLISINEPDVFRGLPEKCHRICWQFLNDFTYCAEGFDNYVDTWLGVCEQQATYLKHQIPPSNKWDIVGLGCSPEWYKDERVPGRVVWCSSADRGLHWLLQEWSKIKEAVPYASLKIFYHLGFGGIDDIEHNSNNANHMKETGNRIRYIKHAIKKLEPLGVEFVGSISREQMKKELNEASVFGFPCDTTIFSEGFSISTMEAHASFTVPVITDKDCLGQVYKNSGALIVKTPVKDNIDQFRSLVIKSLLDKRFSDAIIDKCRVFAMQNTWDIVAEDMEKIILKGKKITKRLENAFAVYNVCGDNYANDCHCGPGSTLENTKTIRKELVPFLNKHNITSILDCPCGDFNWMSTVNLENIRYIGGDVVGSQVELNKKLYPNKDFIHIDLTEDELPKLDLLFCRGCLFHFNKSDKLLALHNFVKSNIPYILITNYPNCEENIELLRTNDFKQVNWKISPFNFPEPLDILNDGLDQGNVMVMNLYSRDQIEKAIKEIL
jgi:hypothetical protein